jgi:hypothetical protein
MTDMASMTSHGQSPWLLLKRAIGLGRKPAPATPRPAAYDDYWALQNRKDSRPAPIKK